MAHYGIDVSHWQADHRPIDWQRVKAAGREFAIIKAAQGGRGGRLYQDKKFRENIKGASAAGMGVGVYLYSTALTVADATAESKNLVALLSPFKAAIRWPVAYDIEEPEQTEPGRRAVNTAQARAFCDIVRAAGYMPVVYTSASAAEDALDMDAVGAELWLAHYTYKPLRTSYKGAYTIHQYSDRGTVPGINGGVDLNISTINYSQEAKSKMYYQTIDECPEWARETVRRLVGLGVIKGDAKGLGLSEDMLRTLVFMVRYDDVRNGGDGR